MQRFSRFTAFLRALGCACPPLFTQQSCGKAAAAFLLVFSSVGAVATPGLQKDTITIDGAPLELQLALSDAPAPPGRSGSKARNMSRLGPDFVLGVATGFNVHSSSTLGTQVSTFIGKAPRALTRLHSGLEWRNDRRFLRCEASASVWNNWSYDASSLNDSIYELQTDGKGGVEQLIRFTYPDLGIELDTLSLPVALYTVHSVSLGLGLGGVIGKGPKGRKLPSHWCLNIMGNRTYSKREGNAVNRVPDSVLPSTADVLAEARNDWEPNGFWSLGVSCGASVPWGRNGWECTFTGHWFGGVAPRMGLGVGVQKRWLNKR